MLRRESRVSTGDFSAFFKKSRAFHSKYIILRVAPAHNEKKFAFIVSKKVSKLSPTRNLLKRQSRAIVKKHLSEISSDTVYFFLFKKNTNTLSFLDLEKEVLFLLKKAQKIELL